MALKDIGGDKDLARTNGDDDLHDFLEKLEKCVDESDPWDKAIIVLLTNDGMSLHLLDLDEAAEKIDAAGAE